MVLLRHVAGTRWLVSSVTWATQQTEVSRKTVSPASQNQSHVKNPTFSVTHLSMVNYPWHFTHPLREWFEGERHIECYKNYLLFFFYYGQK